MCDFACLFVCLRSQWDSVIGVYALTYLKVAVRVTGHVRSAYAAFIDVGCESDAFLHKTTLEDAYKNRIIFDCADNISVGQTVECVVTSVDSEANKMEVGIDEQSAFVAAKSDRLVLPDDFDESVAFHRSIFGLLSDDISDLIF